ncbi:MAG: RdgB/HAM1 family non-canonical purine NTP pyrophosphatase [Chitinophagales bacterium]|nr:RdgB/HAM1 family non-canonical purine NTP pyrophosphatase [Chitinophagales bacterium]MDW8394493.1 RdgB/HAM1 family non-canonical purine NTP pyrophosphatase [Chitinophagales bacterium]
MPEAPYAKLNLVFASRNPHKLAEYRLMAPEWLHLRALEKTNADIPEPHHSLEENALAKARLVYNLIGADCFADDSGLEVEALGGAPGYLSARYAGDHATDQENLDRLLRELGPNPNRRARFRTVIALIWKGREYQFTGILPGSIALRPAGSQGFGYDPVFIPEGHSRTLAQMTVAEKNALSHRRLCFDQMVMALRQLA